MVWLLSEPGKSHGLDKLAQDEAKANNRIHLRTPMARETLAFYRKVNKIYCKPTFYRKAR